VTILQFCGPAVSRDLSGEYMNIYRNGVFLGSVCLPVDCDNDHSVNLPIGSIRMMFRRLFPGITFAVHYSRFHLAGEKTANRSSQFQSCFPLCI
jgi:hypothetical protein